MNRSTIVFAWSTSLCGTIGWAGPRADCATYDRAMTAARARSSRACFSLMSSSGFMPHAGASIASALCTSTRMSPEWIGIGNGSAGGRPGLNRLSTSSPQTCPNVIRPTRSSMSTPR